MDEETLAKFRMECLHLAAQIMGAGYNKTMAGDAINPADVLASAETLMRFVQGHPLDELVKRAS